MLRRNSTACGCLAVTLPSVLRVLQVRLLSTAYALEPNSDLRDAGKALWRAAFDCVHALARMLDATAQPSVFAVLQSSADELVSRLAAATPSDAEPVAAVAPAMHADLRREMYSLCSTFVDVLQGSAACSPSFRKWASTFTSQLDVRLCELDGPFFFKTSVERKLNGIVSEVRSSVPLNVPPRVPSNVLCSCRRQEEDMP